MSAGDILSRTFALVRLVPVPAALAFVLMTAVGMLIDSGTVMGGGADALNLFLSCLILVLQFWIVRALLEDLRLPLPERPRFPVFFLAGIVTTLGIMLGLVLLILPGIVLFVRWSLTVPIILGGDRGVFDSIGDSWRATSGSSWPIFLVWAAIYGPGTAIAALGLFPSMVADPMLGAAIFNLGFNAALIVGWYASVAIYVRLLGPATIMRVFD